MNCSYTTCTKNTLKWFWNLWCMFLVPTNCTQTVQNVYIYLTVPAWNCLCMFFCTYILCANYTKSIQLLNWNYRCLFFVHTDFMETIQNLYNYLTETAAVYFLYTHAKNKLPDHTNIKVAHSFSKKIVWFASMKAC